MDLRLCLFTWVISNTILYHVVISATSPIKINFNAAVLSQSHSAQPIELLWSFIFRVQGLQLWRFRAKVAVLKGQGRQKFVAIRHAKSGDFGSLGGATKLWRFWAKKWRF